MRSSALVAGALLAVGCGGAWSVRSSGPKVGSLEKEEIRRVIRSHALEVRDCYQRRVDEGGELPRKLKLQLRIVAGGGVERAAIVESSSSDEGVERCIVDHALGWRFAPPTNNGTVIVTYPFAVSVDTPE